MQQSQWEIVILKPTEVFRSFLAAFLPEEVELPELSVLQTDTTAYRIRKQSDEEATFDEIYQHFSVMFRHEISRWLGEDAHKEIEGSFLDFLCCFKFEFHSRIVLMEASIEEGQQLICVKPKTVLVKWVKTTAQEDADVSTVINHMNVSSLAKNSTVVIKNFKKLSDFKPFIKHYFRPLARAEMLRMKDKVRAWPKVTTFKAFSNYFSVELHSHLIHLH